MMEKALEILLTSGPLSVALLIALYVVWNDRKQQQIYFEGNPKDPERFPGLLFMLRAESKVREDALKTECQVREDHLRAGYELRLGTEQNKTSESLNALIAALKEIE